MRCKKSNPIPKELQSLSIIDDGEQAADMLQDELARNGVNDRVINVFVEGVRRGVYTLARSLTANCLILHAHFSGKMVQDLTQYSEDDEDCEIGGWFVVGEKGLTVIMVG